MRRDAYCRNLGLQKKLLLRMLKVPEDKLGRLNMKQRMPKLLSNLRRAADLKLLDDLERIFLLVQNFADDLPVKKDFVLVHGDMLFRNFLVDDHNQLLRSD
jgi:thiamine kinase-like enzyme